jgi:glycolate oxidase
MLKLAMSLKIHTPKDLQDLKNIILSGEPFLLAGAKTSTVIPFDKVIDGFEGIEFIVDISCLEKKIVLLDNSQVEVTGPVSWEELRVFLHKNAREVGCWPTDQSAFVLSGLATSATGERCYSRGTIRSHTQSLRYLDHMGNHQSLSSNKKLPSWLSHYQRCYENYEVYKNAPFPRLKFETDLMIGTEGQLGVITSAVLKTFELKKTTFVLLPVESWLKSFEFIDILKWARGLPNLLSLEFFDQRCISLCKQEGFEKGRDYIVFEVEEDMLESFVESLIEYRPETDLGKLLVLDEKKFFEFRVAIPRGVNEFISHNRLVKKGTDAQVKIEDFQALIEHYRSMTTHEIDFVLFGHLGDCHLHFNYLPRAEQIELCDQILEEYYDKLFELKGSPFAEHGIGIIKKKYITRFYQPEVIETFKRLKSEMDPKGIFFPIGFMGVDELE